MQKKKRGPMKGSKSTINYANSMVAIPLIISHSRVFLFVIDTYYELIF